MTRLVLFIVFFFFFFLFSLPVYACPSGSIDQDTASCETLACGGSGWWTGRTTYTYSGGTSCTQTEYFSNSICTTRRTDPLPAACLTDCSSDTGCAPGAYCTGGLNFNYCTEARDTGTGIRNGTWCVAWNCGASCNNTTGCQLWPVCNTAPCPGAAPYSSTDTCNTAKVNNLCACPTTACPAGYECQNGGCVIPAPTATTAPTATGVPPTITPTPIEGPTPVPCIRCGAEFGGYCSGAPPGIFPASCRPTPSCTGGTWVYQGSTLSQVCTENYTGVYDFCWVCSNPTPTPTAGAGTPTPTPPAVLSGCLNPEKVSGQACGPTIDSDLNTPGIQGVNYNQSYKCGWGCISPSCSHSQYCQVTQRDDSGEPISGAWTGCSGSCPRGAPPTPTPEIFTISGTAFIDFNANLTREANGADGRAGTKDDEVGYQGVNVYLTAGSLSRQTRTNASGFYEFRNLLANTYTVEIDVPFGFSDTASRQRYAGNTIVSPNGQAITLPPTATQAHFPLVPYKVEGYMYTTTNRDDCPPPAASRTGISGRLMTLVDTLLSPPDFTTTTDIVNTGKYSFSPASTPQALLTAADYSLQPSAPDDTVFSCIYDGTTGVRTPPPYLFSLTSAAYSKNLDFYYIPVRPWFQGKGADMRIDSGFVDLLPAGTQYASIVGSGGTPGVIFSGNRPFQFNVDTTTPRLENSSVKRWVVGGTVYPEVFTPANPSVIRTSYNYLLGVVKQKGISLTEIAGNIAGRDYDACYDPASGCNLSNLPAGFYKNRSTEPNDIYINNSSFSSGNYVILIEGNLYINGKIQVPKSPATTLTVSVSGDIIVDKAVGNPPSSNADRIEGFYSADGSFVVESEAGAGLIGSNCTATPDKKLNIEGTIVVNAGLSGGIFNNRRSLCNDNLNYPTVYIEERPDFLLNAPDILKHPSSVWQEVAP